MADPAKKVVRISPIQRDEKEVAAKIRETQTDELIIAVCGPIGSGHKQVVNALVEILKKEFRYETEIIKISKIIEKEKGTINTDSRFERVKYLQDMGNELRGDHENSYLAYKVIKKISEDREERKIAGDETHYKSIRKCYIIDSIKHPSEYELLELTYRELFYCFGVYSPMKIREDILKKEGMNLGNIYNLVDRDSGEEIKHGQQVRDAFIKSDFFLRVDSSITKALKMQVGRFLHLIFGSEILTSTPHETAMHHAWVAAANSACLSRQVGAALTDSDGVLVSVGWNDVPKFQGGLYRTEEFGGEDEKQDRRCKNIDGGKCFNDFEKMQMGKDVFSSLVKAGLLKEHQLFDYIEVIKNTKIKGLIEFSRSIHAEMHAILSAIHSEGRRILSSKIFTTTYPCHACARHMVAAGISEVYYIEPYRKSLAIDLHGDAISEEENDTKKLRILPYQGVAPRRYFSLFFATADQRKNRDTGVMRKFDAETLMPIHEKSIESIPTLEAIVVRHFLEGTDLPGATENGDGSESA